nr:electron transport complex subunit RsxC [Acutalibacter sp. M00118]
MEELLPNERIVAIMQDRKEQFPKRPYHTHGGAPVPHHKNTWQAESVVMPPPARVVLPMQQHIGAPCKPVVKKGDHVYLGQLVGDSDAYVSAPVHASVSGTVVEVAQVMLTGDRPVEAVVIESDGLMEPDPAIRPPAAITGKQALADAARAAGLVGLGGAGFPAHVKLNVPEGKRIDTLIINVAECEPYVTSDHREALENGKNVLDGVYKVKEILDVHRVLIAVEDNKPDVIAKLTEIADNPQMDPQDEVRVLALQSRYPQGAEKVLVQACTGRMVPAGGLPADVGCLVMNIASVSFLASYMRTGMPLTKKRVTVDGSAVKEPKNVIVPIGTPIKDVMAFCGGYRAQPKKLLMGGPMMGIAITGDELPILKQNNAILAFDENEAKLYETTACIRCGRCVAACPMNLMPTKLEKAAEKKDVETLLELDVMTCMECGCCAFSCPAGRRLVQSIRLGKAYVRKAGQKK